MLNREGLAEERQSVESGLGELALATERLQQAQETIEWQQELIDTLDRGGACTRLYPWDTEGAWRLMKLKNKKVSYEPVIARSELPEGVNIVRRVVDDPELAYGECAHCQQVIPLIGRGITIPLDFGDQEDKAEVAVVHCDRV